MSKVESKAGDIKLSAWTSGFPHFIEVEFYGSKTGVRLHHSELADLEHAAKRMREKLRAATSCDKTRSEI